MVAGQQVAEPNRAAAAQRRDQSDDDEAFLPPPTRPPPKAGSGAVQSSTLTGRGGTAATLPESHDGSDDEFSIPDAETIRYSAFLLLPALPTLADTRLAAVLRISCSRPFWPLLLDLRFATSLSFHRPLGLDRRKYLLLRLRVLFFFHTLSAIMWDWGAVVAS